MHEVNWINKTTSAKRTVALGTFDGVHLGHQFLLKTAVEHSDKECSSCVFTFERPPEQYFKGTSQLLTTFERKIELILASGIEEVAWVPFEESILSLSAEDFVKNILIDSLHAKEVICGFNFRFGKDRRGDIEFLRNMAKEHDFTVTVVKPIQNICGEAISSTLIRESLKKGDLSKASKHLGYYVSYTGDVEHGAGRGRSLGFPTANLRISPDLILPGEGVYLTWCIVPGMGGVPSVTSIGTNPTFSGESRTVESFILDFNADLYNEKLEVQFLDRLRDIIRYESPDDLKKQIKLDVAKARDLLNRFHLQDGRVVLK